MTDKVIEYARGAWLCAGIRDATDARRSKGVAGGNAKQITIRAGGTKVSLRLYVLSDFSPQAAEFFSRMHTVSVGALSRGRSRCWLP